MRPQIKRARDLATFTGMIYGCYSRASLVGQEILLNALAHYTYAAFAEQCGTYVGATHPAITKPRPWPSKVPE